VLVGCRSTEDKLYGLWKGKFAEDPSGGSVSDLMTSLNLGLEFEKDHHYKLLMGMPFEGTWKVSGNKPIFVQTKALGMTTSDAVKTMEAMKPKNGKDFPDGLMNANLDLTLAEDGKTLVGNIGIGGIPVKVNFTKQD